MSQLAEAKANLDEQDAKLAVFKSHYLGSLPDQEKMNLDLLGNQSSQLEAATQALARAQQDKSFHRVNAHATDRGVAGYANRAQS